MRGAAATPDEEMVQFNQKWILTITGDMYVSALRTSLEPESKSILDSMKAPEHLHAIIRETQNAFVSSSDLDHLCLAL